MESPEEETQVGAKYATTYQVRAHGDSRVPSFLIDDNQAALNVILTRIQDISNLAQIGELIDPHLFGCYGGA